MKMHIALEIVFLLHPSYDYCFDSLVRRPLPVCMILVADFAKFLLCIEVSWVEFRSASAVLGTIFETTWWSLLCPGSSVLAPR